jgi:serine protease Do
MKEKRVHSSRLAVAMTIVALLAPQGLRGDNDAAVTNAPPAADAAGIQDKVLALLERAIPCTVNVDGASGVVVGKEGHILTVAHVGRVADRPVRITFPDGEVLRGKTLGNNAKVDAGVARTTEDYEGPHVPMGNSDEVEPGDWCVALGYPVSYRAGEPPAVRLGRVLAIQSHAIVTDCTIMGGDSGGPLFNLQGEVIGISSRASGPPNVNIHVPVNEFTEAWEKFLAGTDWSGCRHDDEGEHDDAFLGIGPDRDADSARVGRVFPASAAEKAGLRKGDVITAIDGTTVDSYTEVLPVIFRRDPGDNIEITVRRDDTRLVLRATLGEAQE